MYIYILKKMLLNKCTERKLNKSLSFQHCWFSLGLDYVNMHPVTDPLACRAQIMLSSLNSFQKFIKCTFL